MLSEEEKKAIESFKNIAIYMGDNYTFSQQGIRNLRENLRIVLPAIEKQSKEIEELKEKDDLYKKTKQLFENDLLGYIKGYEAGRNGSTGLAYKVGKEFADYNLSLQLNRYKESYLEVRKELDNSVSKDKIKAMLENEIINISGFECVAKEDVQSLLEKE